MKVRAASRRAMTWACALLLTTAGGLLVACADSTGSEAVGTSSGGASTTDVGGAGVGGAGVGGAGMGGSLPNGVGGASSAATTVGSAVGGASADGSVSTTGALGTGGSQVAGTGGSGANPGAGGTNSGRLCAVDGDGTLQFQADVDRLVAQGCNVIEGALVFRGPSILDLSGLETIREVESLGIEQTGLEDLHGLDGLTTVTRLTIANNQHLSSLELPALKTVSERFQIEVNSGAIQLPSLESVKEFAIVGNPSVTSVRMDALVSVESFWVQANQNLTTLHDLPSLAVLGSVVSIDGNPTLPQCEVDAILARAMVDCFSCAGNNDETAVCD